MKLIFIDVIALTRQHSLKYFIPMLRIHMFLSLPDPHPDTLVTSMDSAPDPALDPFIIKQK
jgi:hypothetical protein